MKRLLRLVIITVVLLIIYTAAIFLIPTREDLEQAKMKHLKDRNAIEKQMVGKWYQSASIWKTGERQPKKKYKDKKYYRLSADGGYTYRYSKHQAHGGTWSVNLTDSLLFFDQKTPSKATTIE